MFGEVLLAGGHGRLLGDFQRLAGFWVAAPNRAARPRLFERLAESPGPPQSPRTALRALPRLAENRSGAPKSPAPQRSQGRLSEDSGEKQNLRRPHRVFRRPVESFGGSPNLALRFRIPERLSDPWNETPKLPGFRRIFHRALESSKAFQSLPAHIPRFAAPFESSGLRPSLPRTGGALPGVPEGSRVPSNLLRRAPAFWEAPQGSVRRPEAL